MSRQFMRGNVVQFLLLSVVIIHQPSVTSSTGVCTGMGNVYILHNFSIRKDNTVTQFTMFLVSCLCE